MDDNDNKQKDCGSEWEDTKREWKKCADDDSWWEDRTLPQKILIGIGFGILGVGLLFLFGWIVMLLWNWLVPSIIGWKPVSYWQAWGILVLCTILFKGFGCGGNEKKSDRKRKKQLRKYIKEESGHDDQT
jgi:hypothetical protein